jgi:charged multivesicular body protein 2A
MALSTVARVQASQLRWNADDESIGFHTVGKDPLMKILFLSYDKKGLAFIMFSSWLFGTPQSPAQMMDDSQSAIRKSVSELKWEVQQMEKSEQMALFEIKRAAEKGQVATVRAKSKSLVRKRNAVAKFYQMIDQLEAVSEQIQLMRSTSAIGDAMKNVARAMHSMNQQINMPAMARIMKQFERESNLMTDKQEMMNDAIDGVTAQEGDEEAEDELVNRILDEVGINLISTMNSAPSTTGVLNGAVDTEMKQRLENLRK